MHLLNNLADRHIFSHTLDLHAPLLTSRTAETTTITTIPSSLTLPCVPETPPSSDIHSSNNVVAGKWQRLRNTEREEERYGSHSEKRRKG